VVRQTRTQAHMQTVKRVLSMAGIHRTVQTILKNVFKAADAVVSCSFT